MHIRKIARISATSMVTWSAIVVVAAACGDSGSGSSDQPKEIQSESGVPTADGSVEGADGGVGPADGHATDDASASLEADSDEGPEESAPQAGGVSVLTRSYNNARTGANTSETILTQSNVSPNTFGRLFQVPVDDQVFAQILYVADLSVAGVAHDVAFVATVNNTIYALDAASGAVLWQRNYNGAGRAARISDTPTLNTCYNFTGNFGTVSTPVIDAVTGTMYFVTHTRQATGTVYALEAIDITTGNDRPASPVTIQPSGAPFPGGAPAFDPSIQNQRAGLALANGAVYIAFASYCDFGQYHGWVLAYDAASLASTGTFNVTPGGSQGGIWQGAAAPAVDSSGNVYVATGNGTSDGVTAFGQSLVKLAPRTLGVEDFYTPSAFANLNEHDLDFGSAGPSLMPGTGLVVNGGKQGIAYVMSTVGLGGVANGDTQIVQSFQAVDTTARPTATHHIHNAMVPWIGPGSTSVFVWGENDYLRKYQFNPTTQQFATPAAAVGAVLPPVGMPGGMLAVSSNGAQAGTGIVWTTTPSFGDSNNAITPGIVRAFNAETLDLLWDSRSPGDDPMAFAKFNPVTVANGKLFVPSFSGVVSAYGPRTGPPPPIPNATFALRTGTDSGLCAGIPGGSGTEAAAVQQLACDGTGSQQWQFVNITNNVYEVKEVANGKCLDVVGGSGAAGALVDQYTCNGTVAQQWTVEALGNAQYVLQPRTAANLCLDVSGESAAPGTAIQQWTCDGTSAQTFTLAFDSTGATPIPSGTYRIETLTAAGNCLDATGTYINLGDVAQDTCSGTDTQRWRVKNVNGNVYAIRAAASELCLDVAGGSAADGSVVQQYSCNASQAQQWSIKSLGTSRYALMPQTAAGECAGVSGGSATAGTGIVESACDGSAGNSFMIVAP